MWWVTVLPCGAVCDFDSVSSCAPLCCDSFVVCWCHEYWVFTYILQWPCSGLSLLSMVGENVLFSYSAFFRGVPRVVFNTVLGWQELAATSMTLHFCKTSQGHRSFIRIFSDNCWRLISFTKQNGPVKIAQGGSSGVPFLSMVKLLSGFIMLGFGLKFLVLSGATWNVDGFLFCSLKHF